MKTMSGSWQLTYFILAGIIVGLSGYIFYISNAHSYLSDDPQTCINCHVMTPQYVTWNHSSHRENATCNDCHVPHDNVFKTYYFKAADGLRHATIYTLRAEPQVIQIKEAGIEVVQENCIRCHTTLNETIFAINEPKPDPHTDKSRLCWDCHREVPHGRVNSLSSVTVAKVPQPGSQVPDWIKNLTNSKQED